MNSFIVAKRIIKQLIKDKRTIALIFIAPVFVIFLLYVVLNSSIKKPEIISLNLPSDVESSMKKYAEIKTNDKDTAIKKLKDRNTDAVLELSDGKLTISVEGTETSVTAAVKKAVSSGISDYSKKLEKNNMMDTRYTYSKQSIKITDTNYSYINGSDSMTSFDSIAGIMMGFFIFFFVFLIAGISFLRERITGTLDRILATPIRRFEIVLGYFIGFGVFVLIDTLIIQLFMVYGLKISLKGDFLLLLLINILLAATSLSLGTLLSAFARNEMQLFQFIPVVIVPQIIFCGLFNLRGAPLWTIMLSKAFPLTYAADALTNVALRGFKIDKIIFDILILLIYTVVFLVLNSFVLKKYRRL